MASKPFLLQNEELADRNMFILMLVKKMAN
jgi:hypothetical protein